MYNINIDGGVNVIEFNITADTYSVSASNNIGTNKWVELVTNPTKCIAHCYQIPQTTTERTNTITFKSCDNEIISAYTISQTRGYDDVYLQSNSSGLTFTSDTSTTAIIYFDLYIDASFIGPSYWEALEYVGYSVESNSQYATVTTSDMSEHSFKMTVSYNPQISNFPNAITCTVLKSGTTIAAQTIRIVIEEPSQPFVFQTDSSLIPNMFVFEGDDFDYFAFEFVFRKETENQQLVYDVRYGYDVQKQNNEYEMSCNVSATAATNLPGYDAQTQTLTCEGLYDFTMVSTWPSGDFINYATYENQNIVTDGATKNNITFGGHDNKIHIYVNNS